MEETKAEEPKPSRLSPAAQNKILAATVVLLLMGASFVAGRFSVQNKPSVPDTFTQIPTPQPSMPQAVVPESALPMIDFTSVSETKKAEVLSAFNTELCRCNCKMSVAACIVRDPNCPYWKEHVTELQKALGNGKKPNLSKAPKRTMSMQQLSIPPGSPSGFTFPQGTGK